MLIYKTNDYGIHSKDTICISRNAEDLKGVIRSLKLKKDKQHNSQKKKVETTNNDLQNITQKTKD